MQPRNLAVNTRDIILGEEAQASIRKAVQIVFDTANVAYGPASGNVGIEAQYGDPISSHDGVFNLDHLHITDPKLDIPARILIQASKRTNVHVGDGTTAAAIVGASVYLEAVKQMAATNEPPFSVARRIRNAAAKVVELIDAQKVEATPDLLQAVAIISASDEAIGSLISDTVQEIGADGGVIIEDFRGAGIFNDLVSGFYFRRGFTHAALLTDPSNLESRFDQVFVCVCEKQLSTIDDIGYIFDKCMSAKIKQLVLVGDVQTEALALAIKLHVEYMQSAGNNGIRCTIVDAPVYGSLRTLFLDDLALYVGGQVLSGGANSNEFSIDMLGAAKVVITEYSSSFLNGERNETQEAELKDRINELTEELKVATSPIEQEEVRNRLGRLTGRIAILRVGGNSEVEQMETKLRVEDAVAALQAAIKEGVVPGGGTTLARLPADIDFKGAFEQPLLALLTNAGRNAQKGLWKVQEAKPWHGYDLRDDSEKLVDLKKAGVVDPTLVIKEVVQNGCSVAAELIKMRGLMPFDNREAKRG